MGDLTCADKQHKGRMIEPASNNYDGTYRCGPCGRRYLAAGGQEYSDTQRATFARIDNIDGRPKVLKCPNCGSTKKFLLGTLGGRTHYRCRDCATDFSHDFDDDYNQKGEIE